MFFFFSFKNKTLPLFSFGSFPLNLLSSGLSAKHSSPRRGLRFHIPSPGAKSCKDASQSQLYPATSAQVIGPLLNYYRLLADFFPPAFPRCQQISPGPPRRPKDVTGYSNSRLLLRRLSQTARLVLLDRQLAFVPHFAFCSRRRARLQAWDVPGALAARAPPGTSPCSAGLQCNPIGKSSPLRLPSPPTSPGEEGSVRGGDERGRFDDKGIPHLV